MNRVGEPIAPGDSSHVTLVADEPAKLVAHIVDENLL